MAFWACTLSSSVWRWFSRDQERMVSSDSESFEEMSRSKPSSFSARQQEHAASSAAAARDLLIIVKRPPFRRVR